MLLTSGNHSVDLQRPKHWVSSAPTCKAYVKQRYRDLGERGRHIRLPPKWSDEDGVWQMETDDNGRTTLVNRFYGKGADITSLLPGGVRPDMLYIDFDWSDVRAQVMSKKGGGVKPALCMGLMDLADLDAPAYRSPAGKRLALEDGDTSTPSKFLRITNAKGWASAGDGVEAAAAQEVVLQTPPPKKRTGSPVNEAVQAIEEAKAPSEPGALASVSGGPGKEVDATTPPGRANVDEHSVVPPPPPAAERQA